MGKWLAVGAEDLRNIIYMRMINYEFLGMGDHTSDSGQRTRCKGMRHWHLRTRNIARRKKVIVIRQAKTITMISVNWRGRGMRMTSVCDTNIVPRTRIPAKKNAGRTQVRHKPKISSMASGLEGGFGTIL